MGFRFSVSGFRVSRFGCRVFRKLLELRYEPGLISAKLARATRI